MKLHLPSRLRSSVLLSLSAFSALSPTLSTGILSSSAVVISLAASPAKGAPIVDKTFEYAGTTYSGAELVTLDVSNTANVAAGGTSHTISYIDYMTVTLDIDGTPTDKKMTDKVHALNSKSYSSNNYEIWNSFSSNYGIYGYGQTLKLTGADAAWTLSLNFSPSDFGGLITEAFSDSGSYTIGCSWSALNITANETAGANMLINAETQLTGSGATVNTSGTWVLNKNLTFAETTTVAADKHVTLSGEGALNISGSLTLSAGARIEGENNAINASGSLLLDLSGLTAGTAPLISTDGAVTSESLFLANYFSLPAGEYALISTTDSAAATLIDSFTNIGRCNVSNRNGLVMLTVSEKPNIPPVVSYPNGSTTYTMRLTKPLTLEGYKTILFMDSYHYSTSRSEGGIIYNGDSNVFSLRGNGDVSFCGNSASGSLSVGGAIYNSGTFSLYSNGDVTFRSNSAQVCGAIENTGTFSLYGNINVTFSGNAAKSTQLGTEAGAISNSYHCNFSLRGNSHVTFSGNIASFSSSAKLTYVAGSSGGAIFNMGYFTLSGNGDATFCENKASSFVSSGTVNASGGAIYNSEHGSSFILSGNGNVIFRRNAASSSSSSIAYSSGGAISNFAYFTLSGNGDVIFSENTVFSSSSRYGYSYGGAILNNGTFTLSGNENVLFEKNAEIRNGVYRLRSIYSVRIADGDDLPATVLNLSAAENHSILFRDSIYAGGIVNLNQDGTGDIILSCATTEADLREVKGGVDGTAEEILNSRTSEIVTNAKLYGGRLIVEDGAILKGQGITVMENANATIRLNNATLDETGYTIAVSTGSGLELEGENTLKAASVQLADGATLSFVMGEGNGTDWDAQLVTGQLNVQVSGDLFNEHRLLTLHDGSQYDTSLWTSDAITVSGTTFDSLSWNAGVLTYTPHVIEAEEDGTFDDKLPDNGNAVIDGNGHSLTVKNAVQLVQMALKNGTVKLEGENNGIVSVTLTEGGELVLAAGAGLKTGDIISMVASGKGELVISGDITLDEHGMKGKNGQKATVSNMSATTTGDAVFENVAFTDSLLDIGEGTTATFRNAVLGAGTRVTDAPATAKFENTLALLDSTNTEVVTESTTAAALQLYMSGDTANAVTLDAGAALVDLTCTVFDTITLSGSDLYLDLTALAVTLGDADAFSLTFTNGTLAAIDTDSLSIYATLDGEHYLAGYTTQQGGMAEKVYFTTSASVPEPATATLSLLALAALVARRKRVA